MKNGTAFRTFFEETTAFLDGLSVAGLYAEPLPSVADERMGEIVTRVLTAAPGERRLFHQTLHDKHRSLLGIAGHRLATLAAREESKQKLRLGLAAAAIANFSIPEKRNVEVALAVYYHCARKLGMNIVDLFEEAADLTSPETAVILRSYGRRSDVTLHKYGWREIKTPDGIKFKFQW
ncbi:MAG: hypothetical protein ACE5E7_18695 [Anaerolineae bacterium]